MQDNFKQRTQLSVIGVPEANAAGTTRATNATGRTSSTSTNPTNELAKQRINKIYIITNNRSCIVLVRVGP